MNNSFMFRGNDYSELFKNFGKIKLTRCICCKSKNLTFGLTLMVSQAISAIIVI